MQRSGNPGYQLQEPIITAYGETTEGSKLVPYGGLYFKGTDSDGNCLVEDTDPGEPTGVAERLNFGRSMTLGCKIGFSTLSEFYDFCESTTRRLEYTIFD